MKQKLIIILGVAFTLVSCNSNSSNPSNFAIIDVNPSNNSQITVNQTFIANFNNVIDPSTVGNVSLTSQNGTNIVINCSANAKSLTCIPVTPLTYGVNYKISYSSGIKNTAGNSLALTSFNYSTYNQDIANVTPASGSISPNNNVFIFKFSRDMNQTTLDSSVTTGNVTMVQGTNIINNKNVKATNVPITCSAIDSKTMRCTVATNQLILNTEYIITLTDKIKDSNSTPIVEQTINYQTSDYTAPVATSNPTSGSIGVNQLTYKLSFNALMDSSTFMGVKFTDNNISAEYPMNCTTTDNQSYNCIVQGLSQLVPDHNYTMLLKGIISKENIPLPTTSFTYNVNNYTVPQVNFINPVSGGVSLNQLTYNIQFNESMNTNTINNGVTFKDTDLNQDINIGCTSLDTINFVCTLQGVTQLVADHNYALILSNSIKSSEQVPLVAVTYNYAATNYVIPQISSIVPVNNSSLALTGSNITVNFTSTMDTSTLVSANVMLRDTDTESNIVTLCSAQSNTVMKCTLGKLIPNHNYIVILSNAITSALGVPITEVSFNYMGAFPSSYSLIRPNSINGLQIQSITGQEYIAVSGQSSGADNDTMQIYKYSENNYSLVYNGNGPFRVDVTSNNGVSIGDTIYFTGWVGSINKQAIYSFNNGTLLNITGNNPITYPTSIAAANNILYTVGALNTDNVIYQSINGGANWTQISAPPIYNALFSFLATDAIKQVLYLATYSSDSKTANIYSFNGISWSLVTTIPSSGDIASFIVDNNVIYLLFYNSVNYVRALWKYNGSWSLISSLSGFPQNGVSWGDSFAVRNNNVFYYNTSGFFAYQNNSSSWIPLSSTNQQSIQNITLDATYNVYFANGFVGTPQ